MDLPGRRSILKSFSLLPFVGALMARVSFADSQDKIPSAEDKALYEKRFLAVKVLRVLNTAQHWHKAERGSFFRLADIYDSPAFTRLHNDEHVRDVGLGASFLDQLSFDKAEVSPGWWIRMDVSNDLMKYAVLLADDVEPGKGKHHFSSDDSARIFEGAPIDSVNFSSNLRGFDYVSNGAQIQSAALADKRGGSSLFLKRLASLALPAPKANCCWVCQGFPCCVSCFAHCFDQLQHGYLCINCGCESCVWSCTIY